MYRVLGVKAHGLRRVAV